MRQNMLKSRMSEFKLIDQYFTRPVSSPNVHLGIGDDCALLSISPNMQLAISSDMLVEGRHFFPGANPEQLGHKSLAVNLSDLAAMGAKPIAFTLSLSLPEANPQWLGPFAKGLFALADQHHCSLIGGDTTKGPLNISITILGEIPPGHALRRNAAQVNDDIWISGSLGDARLALASYHNEITLDPAAQAIAGERMHKPTPRVELGIALRNIAHAAIDISDGLSGDLGHILKQSHVGATLMIDQLPAGPMLRLQKQEIRRHFSFAGGDDYELCFTVPVEKREAVLAASRHTNITVTRIGTIEAISGLRLVDSSGTLLNLDVTSFDHFSSP